MLKDQLAQDLKAAMLAGDKMRVDTLKMLKSAILNEEVAKRMRDTGLDDASVAIVFKKEAKKRLEAAELYKNAGEAEREAKERAEYDVIATYLPAEMSDDDLLQVVTLQIAKLQPQGMQDMGKVISAVKGEVGEKADGSRIAKLVKEQLSS